MNEKRHDNPDHESGRRALFNGIGHLCEIAVRLTGADGAAIALLTPDGGVRELVYASDIVSQQLDDLQFTLGAGPCIDCFTHNQPYLVDDLSDGVQADEWPMFGSEAATLGAQALFAFPVSDDGVAIGVLELYRRTRGGLSDTEQASAAMCAQAAGSTVRRNWEAFAADHDGAVDDLAVDLADTDDAGEFSRARVYLASGMIAVQLAISPDEALDRLRALSIRLGRPISEIAEGIVNRTMDFRNEDEDDLR